MGNKSRRSQRKNQLIRQRARGLGFDAANAAPATRARFRYQDECVAVVILTHLASAELLGVLVEFNTDVILIPTAGKPELVSIKHREASQLSETTWSMSALKKQSVLRDLYRAWKRCDDESTVAFWSNGGFSGRAYELWQCCAELKVPSADIIRAVAANIGKSHEETEKFIDSLRIPREPLPRRKEIGAVGRELMARFLLSRGHVNAYSINSSYEALVAAIAAAGTEESSYPVESVAATLRAAVTSPQEIQTRRGYLASEVIVQVVLEAAQNADSSSPKSSHRTRWNSDPLFVGREKVLSELEGLLAVGRGDCVAPVVLHGVPGCGKTSVALQFAAMHQQELEISILNGSSKASLVRDLKGKAGLQRSTESLLSDLDPPFGPTALGLPADPRRLLIIDGVTDIDSIVDLIPRSSLCRVLITSTVPFIDLGFCHLALESWTRVETLSFIMRAMPDASRLESEQLALALYDHPLAISQAVSYCRTTGRDIPYFLHRLSTEPLRILDRGRAAGHRVTTLKTVQLSVEALQNKNRDAVDVLRLFSHFGTDPIPHTLFEGRWGLAFVLPRVADSGSSDADADTKSDRVEWELTEDQRLTTKAWRIAKALENEERREDALDCAFQTSLVQLRADGWIIHPLISLIVRAEVGDPLPWLELGFGLVSRYIPEDGSDDEPSDPWIDHIISLASNALEARYEGVAAVISCIFLSRRLAALGMVTQGRGALYFAERGLALLPRAISASEVPEIAIVTQRQAAAHAYFWAGKISEALALLDLNIRYGEEIGSTDVMVRAIVDVGAIAVESSDADLARRVLANLPPDNLIPPLVQASVRVSKSAILRYLGRIAQAWAILDEAFNLMDQSTPLKLREEAHRMAAQLARDHGDDGASYRHEQAVAELRRTRGGTRPDSTMIGSLIGLAGGALDVGDLDRAEEVLEEASRLLSGTFDRKSLMFGEFLGAQGRLRLLQHRCREAQDSLREAAAILDALPYARAKIPAVLIHLGQAAVIDGKAREAIRAVERALEIDREIYGPSHPETIKDVEILRGVRQYARRFR